MPADSPKSLDDLASHIALRKQTLSETIAADIISLFRLSVTTTVILTIILAGIDYYAIFYHNMKPESRLVSERVLLAIIGASIVQLGAAAGAIVYSLFGRTQPSNGAE